jgi:hypothetical protein
VISTFLADNWWLVDAAIPAVIIVGLLFGVLLTPRPRVTRVLLVLSVILVLAVALYPETLKPAMGCHLALDYWGLDKPNVILFIPPVLLAGVLFRRPWLAIVAGSLLSVLIEVVQLLIPAIGRSCDLSDWISNTIGAVIGGVLAFLALWIAGRLARRATAAV